MTALALAILVLSFVAVVYGHLGFPALLSWMAARARRNRPRRLPVVVRDAVHPMVSIIVAAWNEEAVIGAKIENALAQDYPADKLELVVATDGCTDRTNEIVASRLSSRVRLVALPQRGGKARAIRHAAQVARGEIFVLTDANAFFALDAVTRLVDRLGDDTTVSCAFGNVQIRSDGCPFGASEGIFFRIERAIQRFESDLDSAVGTDGALYAIRREAFVPAPDGAVLDDLEVAIEATRHGRRVVYEPRAIAWEDATPTLAQELRRKTRIVAGALQAMRAGRMLPDRDRRMLWFLFASHKLLRWAQPVFLILMLLASAIAAPASSFALAALVGQLVFYAAAGIGLLLHERVALGRLSLPLYFTAMHAAGLLGLLRGARNGQSAAWQRADRKPVLGTAAG
jgi:cellulose synthase/poly-beta-1,6-N-acetylglucosamine synthase-like glycosyltransferase